MFVSLRQRYFPNSLTLSALVLFVFPSVRAVVLFLPHQNELVILLGLVSSRSSSAASAQKFQNKSSVLTNGYRLLSLTMQWSFYFTLIVCHNYVLGYATTAVHSSSSGFFFFFKYCLTPSLPKPVHFPR